MSGIADRQFREDDTYVYGMNCCWHGSINETALTDDKTGIPCCPHCGCVLYQAPRAEWWEGAKEYDAEHPGYLELLKWVALQKKCWPFLTDAAEAYKNATGKTVQL